MSHSRALDKRVHTRPNPGGFKPGNKLAKGRPKGVPNAINATIKEMIIQALNDVGGRRYLAKQAIAQPVAFMGLLGRVLPLQLSTEEGKPIAVAFEWSPATHAQTPPTLTLDAEPEPASIEAPDATSSDPAE